MDFDWSPFYARSASWKDDWQTMGGGGNDWPTDMHVYGDKMYVGEKLCVPEDLEVLVVREHHVTIAHASEKRLLAELDRRYCFPATCGIKNLVHKVKSECMVCQACEPPTESMQTEIHFTPVPDRFMASVCLDVFSMPTVE